MSPYPPLNARHIGVAGAGILLTSAAALWLASMQHVEQVGGFRPVQSANGAGYAIERWQVPTSHRWLYLAGMSACLSETGLLTIVRIGDDTLLNIETLREDIPETIQVLCAQANQFIAAGLQLVFSVALLTGKRTAKFVYLRTAPVPVKDAIAQLAVDRTWFGKFLKARHNWVTGRTGSGKTFLTLALIVDWLEENPDGILTICDLAYGKPDENGWINDWLGLPVEYIRMEPDTIAATVEAEREELDDRRHEGQEAAKRGKRRIQRRSNRLLVIDEWDSTIELLGGRDGKFLESVRFLLKFGGGYGHKVLLSGQTIATGETAISEATRNQLAIAILGTNATKTDEVGKLKSESQPLIERARKIRQREYRPAVVQLGDADPVTVVVSDLAHILNVRIQVETQDPDLEGWLQVFTSDRQKEVQSLAEQYVSGEINSPLKEIAQKLGCSVRSSDMRYTRFLKPVWETLLAHYQTTNLKERISNE
ncbi:AAA family ATPase [Phormidesmis sp. 146-33]